MISPKMLSLFTLFTLPDGAIASTTAYIGELVVDAWPFVALAVGVPLGFYVIRRFIGLVPKGK